MKLKLSLLLLIVCTFSFLFFPSFKAANNSAKSVYDFTMKDIDGNAVSLSKYKGKVLVFVNVASKCGFTPQYESIEKFYEMYKDKGVVVLGFPANNFFAQEPGTDEEIKSFCTSKYNVTFPMFSKISVKGDDMNPLYQFLTKKELNGVTDNSVKWNFHKIIVDKNGKVVTEFASKTKPTDESFLKTIDQLLSVTK
jgi:glutathione peroxidase